ncbi:uncharacterized protein CTRU02_211142 [Colletotrichum truncatum]|uniref:Uncharacterized protein n=1 Tax=Colletotrichum truncatum TaxID=5467 RepID=A0ACC3YQX4_COLTU|nr:uncharacterized protein CTRU02_01921 [Colletotrichum truncatum]KAF6799050.1 hypothetical protein CTRU02_01921 [Colletotrichum truncatum]
MCIQWIASANCVAALNGSPQYGCKGAHVVVVRRKVCDKATERCMCFFGSCDEILTLFQEDQDTVEAPCEMCGIGEDPAHMLLLRIFDKEFAKEWIAAFGEAHWQRCTEGKWLGRYGKEDSEDENPSGDDSGA